MKFEAHYPVQAELKKHILYYYFAKTDDNDPPSSYFSFPNVTIPVNIHKNVSCCFQRDTVVVSASADPNFMTIANGLRESPLNVKWQCPVDKITIAFKAAGINHFISRNLNETVYGYASLFKEWSGDQYTACLEKFYAEPDNEKRVIILENFLMAMYKPFEKSSLLQDVIRLLSDFDTEVSVPDIARQVNLSERTLNRLFQLHIGISPTAYRKIARFRQSLENKVLKEKFRRLTDIGHDSNYYDQSYYIKMYKRLSGKNPKKLYDSVQKLAGGNVIFEFLKSKS